MNEHQLHYFLLACHLQSMRQAAHCVFTTPQNVSAFRLCASPSFPGTMQSKLLINLLYSNKEKAGRTSNFLCCPSRFGGQTHYSFIFVSILVNAVKSMKRTLRHTSRPWQKSSTAGKENTCSCPQMARAFSAGTSQAGIPAASVMQATLGASARQTLQSAPDRKTAQTGSSCSRALRRAQSVMVFIYARFQPERSTHRPGGWRHPPHGG